MTTTSPTPPSAPAPVTPATAVDAPASAALTPSAGRVLRLSLFWIGAAVLLTLVALIALSSRGTPGPRDPLASDNPAPPGAMALAEVLRQQGVTVVAASSLSEARDGIDEFTETTVLVYDPQAILTSGQAERAAELSDNVIFVDPSFEALDRIAPTVAQAGLVSGVLDADCPVPAVANAETITTDGVGYRLIDETDDNGSAVTCLDSGDDVVSLVRLERPGTTLTILGTTAALSNERVIDVGNAAFALHLLGGDDRLVWYIPTFLDLSGDAQLTPADLTPTWVLPAVWILALTALAAAIWRGRRFGPLVFENLPVTVRASETMLGRARLYEKSGARVRALDSLRVGTVQRLATACGLPRTSTVDEVIAAVTTLTGAREGDIRDLLLDREPTSDRDLIDLSDALLTLEADVARRLRG